MKIAVNTRMLISNRMEGVARYTYETTRRMVANHPEHEFFFFFDRPYNEAFIFGPNVTPVILYPPARHPLLWYIYFEYAVAKALKKYEIDVFYSPDNYASLSTKVPTLLVTHDIAFEHFSDHVASLPRKYYQHFVPKYNHHASHIIAVSEATKQDIIRQYKVPEEKVTVAHNSCPDGFRKASVEEKTKIQAEYANGKPYIIYAGSVHPRKNVDSVIKAFHQNKASTDTDIQLVIAGRWAWKTESTRKLIDSSPYRNEIHIYETPDMPLALRGAELALYISLYEGFGIPILEAMQSQIPVITSNLSSMPEVAGDASILVDPKDVEAITASIDSILLDKEKASSMINRGLENIKRFSWDKSASIISDRLTELFH